jgi:hypothetical protein
VVNDNSRTAAYIKHQRCIAGPFGGNLFQQPLDDTVACIIPEVRIIINDGRKWLGANGDRRFDAGCVGLATKLRLPFTVATHLSPVYAGVLLFSWQVTQASLGPASRRVLACT